MSICATNWTSVAWMNDRIDRLTTRRMQIRILYIRKPVGCDISYMKVSRTLLGTTAIMDIKYGINAKTRAARPNPLKPSFLYRDLIPMATQMMVPMDTMSTRSSLVNPPECSAHLASSPASEIWLYHWARWQQKYLRNPKQPVKRHRKLVLIQGRAIMPVKEPPQGPLDFALGQCFFVPCLLLRRRMRALFPLYYHMNTSLIVDLLLVNHNHTKV